MRVSSKLKLTISQINGLRSFIEKTDDKREYRRAVAVFQKADGKTYDYIAREHVTYLLRVTTQVRSLHVGPDLAAYQIAHD
ncbi:MAG: hypothetical protein WBE61_04105, partial [Nitrososphaeraceae archaeon]